MAGRGLPGRNCTNREEAGGSETPVQSLGQTPEVPESVRVWHPKPVGFARRSRAPVVDAVARESVSRRAHSLRRCWRRMDGQTVLPSGQRVLGICAARIAAPRALAAPQTGARCWSPSVDDVGLDLRARPSARLVRKWRDARPTDFSHFLLSLDCSGPARRSGPTGDAPDRVSASTGDTLSRSGPIPVFWQSPSPPGSGP